MRSSLTLAPPGYCASSRTAVHFRPWPVTVAAMPATASSLVIRGRARQVRVMWQNSRCSILFHLLVPGGKWHTLTSRPVSSREDGELVLPPPAAAGVGPTGVADDQQPPGALVAGGALALPPQAQRAHRERSRVAAGPDRHEDPVRRRRRRSRRGRSRPARGRRSRGRGPAPGRSPAATTGPARPNGPTSSFFFASTLTTGVPGRPELRDPGR